MEHATETWTTRSLLAWMMERFRDRGIDSPRFVAEMLLAHVLGCERLRLYMEVDRPAAAAERQALRGLVKRALEHDRDERGDRRGGAFVEEAVVGSGHRLRAVEPAGAREDEAPGDADLDEGAAGGHQPSSTFSSRSKRAP